MRFVGAHVALAKVEIGEILDRAKAAAAKVGVAIAIAIYLAMLLSVGGTLFFGEWLFGSIGWGLLHGLLMSIALIVVLALSALEVPGGRIGGAFAVAFVLGVLVAIGLGLALPNQAYRAIGDNAFTGIEVGVRPLVVGLIVGLVIGAILGLITGARVGGARGAVAGIIGFGILFTLIGAFTAISFSLRVGIALGIAVLLAAWPALAALALRGFDWDALKDSYIPHATIETTKESMEWVRQQTQRARKP